MTSFRFTSTNSYFATIGANNLWPRSRPCSALPPHVNPRPISGFVAQRTSRSPPMVNTTYCGVLKQPDKHKAIRDDGVAGYRQVVIGKRLLKTKPKINNADALGFANANG